MLKKIEDLREDINKMIQMENHNKYELLQKSRELDTYINKFMKENVESNT